MSFIAFFCKLSQIRVDQAVETISVPIVLNVNIQFRTYSLMSDHAQTVSNKFIENYKSRIDF